MISGSTLLALFTAHLGSLDSFINDFANLHDHKFNGGTNISVFILLWVCHLNNFS